MCDCGKKSTHILSVLDVENDEVVETTMCMGHAIRERRALERAGVLAEVRQNIFNSIPRFAVDWEPAPVPA